MRLRGKYVVGAEGRLYLPRTSDNGERERPTCGQEFIKGETPRENPVGVPPWTLSLYSSNKVTGLLRLLCGHGLSIACLFRSCGS